MLAGEMTMSMGDLQDPKMEVPAMCKAYCSGLNFREYPHKIWPEIWYSNVQYLHLLDPGDLLLISVKLQKNRDVLRSG